jgi:preprotein translocase subunit SecF
MTRTINFLGLRRVGFTVSGVLILVGVVSLVRQGGLNLGIDFRGGVHVVSKYSRPVSVPAVRATLEQANIARAKVVGASGGNEVLIDTLVTEAGIGQKIVEALRAKHPVQDTSITEVGASVGSDLRAVAIRATLVALALMLVYISVRFEWRFAVGAVVATAHDVLVVVGVFSWLGLEVNLPTLAAFLTVVGYSINDTIVIFDRIRENQRLLRGMRLEDLMNTSITQMLGRTLLTAPAALTVLLLIFFISPSDELRTFALALIFGILVGTYSSIYVASPIALVLRPKATVLAEG